VPHHIDKTLMHQIGLLESRLEFGLTMVNE
jgi:hypothetical protein